MEKASLRIGKGSPSHNDRTSQNSKANVIDGAGKATACIFKEGRMVPITLGLGILKKEELARYKELYTKSLDRKNAHYKSKGNKDAIKTIEQYYASNEPKEMVLQIGKGRAHTIEEVRKITTDMVNYMRSKTSNNAFIDILNASLHDDESAPHVHIRFTINYVDEKGEITINQNKALKSLNIEPDEVFDVDAYKNTHPEASKKEINTQKQLFERNHNRMVSFTDELREAYYKALKSKHYDIDTETAPNNRSVRNKSVQQYKADRLVRENELASKKLAETKDDLFRAKNDFEYYDGLTKETTAYKNEQIEEFLASKGLLEEYNQYKDKGLSFRGPTK